MLIYTLGLRPLVGLLRYCNPHDNLCWNLTADDLAAYQYLNEVFVVLTWILTSAVFDKNWSVSNCESYVWNSGASKPMGEFVFIRFEFCSIFVNFLPLAMVMSFLNGAAEALVPKECLTCLGHGPGDATSKAWWLSFSPQPPGILEDIAAIAHFQTQPRRIIHWNGSAQVVLMSCIACCAILDRYMRRAMGCRQGLDLLNSHSMVLTQKNGVKTKGVKVSKLEISFNAAV